MIDSFRSLFAPPRHFILIVAAMWIGLTLAEKRTERHGISKEQLNNIVFYSLFGYIIGGRLLFALSNLSAFSQSPLSIFSPNPDLFDPSGGLVTAIFVGFVYGQRQKLQLWGTFDALTPIFAVLAIGLSLAHLAAGTAFGSLTTLPWGIYLWNSTRHPSQIYELIASLAIFGWLWFRKPDSQNGFLFLNFVTLTASVRLFLEAFRGDSILLFGGFRQAQIAAWGILLLVFLADESIRRQSQS